MLICVFLLYFCANNYRVCLILKEFLNLGLLSLNHLFLYYDNTQFVLVQVLLGKAHQCNLHITGQNITSIAIYYFCLGCKLYVWTYQYSWNVYEWCKQETVVVYCLWCDNTKHYFRCGWLPSWVLLNQIFRQQIVKCKICHNALYKKEQTS
jgi:hypothetical protein